MDATNIIFPSTDIFKVIAIDRISEQTHVYVQSKQQESLCPKCSQGSKKLHSYYTRQFRDLPILGSETVIFLRTRKFYCYEAGCPVKVFTERFNDHFSTHQRSTNRFRKVCLDIALQSGGKPAERIARIVNLRTSDSSLLRLIQRASVPEVTAPYALGVDDWAYKKRHRYGTLLVDLRKRKVIDLLKDRQATTLENWLKDHPGVKVISRDRYGEYMQGATRGAPDAIQVVDRWHLLKNLGEAVTKLMIREYTKLNRSLARKQTTRPDKFSPEPLSKKDDRVGRTPSKAKQRFEEVKRLQTKGHSIRAIARHLNMHRQTVKKYMAMDMLPRKTYRNKGMVEIHFPYIKQRMEGDPGIYLKTLWNEIKERGYPGAYTTFSDALIYYGIRVGKKVNVPKLPRHTGSYFKPSKAAMTFLLSHDKLDEQQRQLIARLCNASEDLTKTLSLVRAYRSMMENKSGRQLKNWINQATGSGIKEISSFAKGLLSDYNSIENAVTLSWSNGPVEGNVNKLKTIKRQMYGRGSFELLKKRLVLAPT